MPATLRTLWCFLAAAGAGGVSAGARRMGLAQSTVSAAIRTLEDDIGARLLAPTRLGARLTEVGARLRDHGAALTLDVEHAFADLHSGRVGASEPRTVTLVGAPPGSALDCATLAGALANTRRSGERAVILRLPAEPAPSSRGVNITWRLAPANAAPGRRIRDEWRLLTLRGGASDAPTSWSALAALRVLVGPFDATDAARLAVDGVRPQAVKLDSTGVHFTLLDRKDVALLVPASCLAAGHSAPALSIRPVVGAPFVPEIEVRGSGRDLELSILREATRTVAEGPGAPPRLRAVDARIDLHGLRCFTATMETGNTTRAAQMRGIVQPALSVQLRKLERALKRTLFDRSSAGMTATSAGVRFYDFAAPILNDHDESMRRLRAAAHGPDRRRVRLGLIPAAGESSLVARAAAAALDEWRPAYPDAALTVAEGYTGVLTRWLRAQLVDLALIDTLDQQPGLAIRPILREPIVLVVAPGSRWDDGSSEIEGRSLAEVDLITPSRRFGLRALTERALAETGLAFTPAMEIDGLSLTLRLVKTGRFATVLPSSAIHDDLGAGRLVARRVIAPRIERRLCLATRSAGPPDPVLEALGEQIAAAFQRLASASASGASTEAEDGPDSTLDAAAPRATF
ncbi:LysR family transcriptional regulator [Pikeienuella piscinae]|uniref:LysR family transcriptional regulator n=1 Tax=Pikeienuella piscinae TaxID=2748098 RepID=A0A7M3T688_9RHOB|nr:LysR substrate-binding domain-containing protein [Pikeienuella piscinae]QIE57519.1 LysR family transcriptional regulator [Pikeienuella piscinae]